MGRLGVPDRYVDAFCGRVPQSVLARHYTDFSPERLKEIYDQACPRIFGEFEVQCARARPKQPTYWRGRSEEEGDI
jgi:intergrase/recombinase